MTGRKDRQSVNKKPSLVARDIIEKIRLLPPGLDLPDFWAAYHRLEKQDPFNFGKSIFGFRSSSGHLSVNDVEERCSAAKVNGIHLHRSMALETCTQGLPPAFNASLGIQPETSKRLVDLVSGERLFMRLEADVISDILDPLDRAVDSYQRVSTDLYPRLYRLAKLATVASNQSSVPIDRTRIAASGVSGQVSIQIENGILKVFPDEFLAAFNGIELGRLRLCQKCGRVFWANRSDARGCTARCSSALRTREWRDKTTDEQRTKYKINKIKASRG